MAFIVASSLFTVISALSLNTKFYNNAPNPIRTETILDGTSNVQLVYRNPYGYNDGEPLEGYNDYNWYNTRTSNENEFNSFPYDTHFRAYGQITSNPSRPNQRVVLTLGDSYSGSIVEYYSFTIGTAERISINHDGVSAPYHYHDYFELSRIGNNTTNPRNTYFNAVLDFHIVGLGSENNQINYNVSFPLYDYQHEGGFKTVLNSYSAGDYETFDFLVTEYFYEIDIHLVRAGEWENYYWSEGYEVGEEEGYGEGYGVGYQDGYGVGVNDGYSQGQSSNNAFRNLFGTLIDTPIIYLRKMFDYELFGISVFKALATVLSLIVALSVFRLVRGIF